MKGGHGPIKLLSDSNCGALDHAFYASTSLSDNFYTLASMYNTIIIIIIITLAWYAYHYHYGNAYWKLMKFIV